MYPKNFIDTSTFPLNQAKLNFRIHLLAVGTRVLLSTRPAVGVALKSLKERTEACVGVRLGCDMCDVMMCDVIDGADHRLLRRLG